MIFKFKDRPAPFTIFTETKRMKQDLLKEFEDKYFKLSDAYKNNLLLVPYPWLGKELAKILKGGEIYEEKDVHYCESCHENVALTTIEHKLLCKPCFERWFETKFSERSK